MNILCIGRSVPASVFYKENSHQLFLLIDRKDFIEVEYNFPYERVFLFNGKCLNEYIEAALLLNKFNKIDAICCLNDLYQEIAIAISETLSLKFPLSENTFNVVKNKALTRQELEFFQLPSVAYQVVDSVEDLVKFYNASSARNIILKPLDGTASNGVLKISDQSSLQAVVENFQSYSHHLPAIAEEFIAGKEFSVEAFSESREHRVLAITEKHKKPGSFIEQGHVMHANLSKSQEKEIIAYILKALDAIGISDGPSHSELILTGNGPVLIESHTRVGGDHIHELIHLATGIDIIELTARQFIGESVMHEIPYHLPKKQNAAVWFEFPEVNKKTFIKQFNGKTNVDLLDQVATFRLLKKEGDEVGPAKSSLDRIALAVSSGDSAMAALSAARNAIAQLQPCYVSESLS